MTSAGFPMTSYQIGKASNAGRARAGDPNQDSMAVIHPGFPNRLPPLLVVADGMGGYRGGETASKLLIETLKTDYFAVFGGNIKTVMDRGLKKLMKPSK